jgi:alginate O-acetyltransferase complex protein AlgJ
MTTPKKSPSSVPTPPSEWIARVSKVSGYTLIGLLGVGLVSCGWLLFSGQVQMLPPNLTRDAVVHGDVTHKIAKQLSKAWFPAQAANLERGVSWLLFHDTGPRVRPGCQGWLFLTDEMRINRHARANADTKARAVIDVQQRLSQRNIQLLVAVVPDKSRIVADQLCGLDRPAELARRAVEWTTTLNQAGVSAVNLAPMLQPLGASAYLRTDTHWSESGSSAAAQTIAQQVQQMRIRATPQKTFAIHSDAAALRAGDLVRLAGIDWLPMSWQPTPETVVATQVSAQQEAAKGASDNLDDLFGDDALPNVALIGTSFSRNSNFLGFLELALGAPVGSFAKDGGEFSGAANQYFSNPAFRETPPRLLIWEIPERDLQTPYEAIEMLSEKE